MTSKGSQEDLGVFEQTAVEEVSSRERRRRIFEEWVISPLRILIEDKRTLAGASILMVFFLLGTVGVLLVPLPSPDQGPRGLGAFQSWEYPLGTTVTGQDILGQLVHATPAMWLMLMSGALFSTIIATVIGTIAGYIGGKVDIVLTTITDVFLAIPGLPLIMVLAVVLQPGNPIFVGIILSANAWAGLARSIRSEVISLTSESYIEASQVLGLSMPTIVTRDVLPNLMPYITVNFVVAGRRVIFGSVALYFLGMLPITGLNWGIMLQLAYDNGALYLPAYFHWLLVPTLAIVGLTVALLLVAQGAEQIFNPRIRARHTDDESESTVNV
jgi:peptide/nickel transport system permease protein